MNVREDVSLCDSVSAHRPNETEISHGSWRRDLFSFHTSQFNQPIGQQNGSHHQVAAVNVEGRPGDVTGGLGSGEANQIGDFERSAEARYGIARGEAFEQLVRSMFTRQLR